MATGFRAMMTSLVDFLERAEGLKKLDLNEQMFTKISESDSHTKFKFHLTTYEMSYHCKMTDTIGKNFSAFLFSQASSLTDLDVRGSGSVPSVVYSTIINNLDRLSTLKIDVSSLPSHRFFYEKLKPNISLKHLWLFEDFPSEEAGKGFLGSCPNIEKIVSYQNVGNCIKSIATFNPNLVDFKLNSITVPVSTGTRFNKLKLLTIRSIKDSDAWMSLVASCPTIESLTVEWVDVNTIGGREVEFLLQQLSLRHLKFDGDYEETKIIFDEIKWYYGNLKTLELVMSETSEYGTTVTAEVKFEFPADSLQWSVEEAEKKFLEAWDCRSW